MGVLADVDDSFFFSDENRVCACNHWLICFSDSLHNPSKMLFEF